MLMRVKTLAFMSLCAGPLYAQSAAPGPGQTTGVPDVQDLGDETKNEAKAFQSTFSLTHYFSARRASDPLTQLTLGASYQLNEQWSVSAEEIVSKLYYVNEDENEVQFSDAELRLRYKLPSLTSTLGATNLRLGLSTTLPLSESSREHDVWTVSTAHFKAEHKLLDDRLALSLQPTFAYHFNEYRSMSRDDAGKFLIRYRYILVGELSYKITDKLALSYAGDWQKRHFEQPKRKGQNNSPNVQYNFVGAVSYDVQKNTSLSVGYSQKDRADLLGNVDVNFFDEEVSLVFVDITHSL